MAIKNIHRITGIIIAVFVTAHLFNHSMAWFGIDTHREIMENFRKIYRNPVAEFVLLGCFGFQVFSGITLIRNNSFKNASFFERLKLLSGGYLAFFIVAHTIATVGGRQFYHLDTNFYYAAYVVIAFPHKLFYAQKIIRSIK